MRIALKDIAVQGEKLVKPMRDDLILDIGCNDGTLLRSYGSEGLKLVGFEPGISFLEEARKGTTKICNDFFNLDTWRENFGKEKAKIITAIAMFYDLDDPNEFVSDVAEVLAEDGVFIVEQRYLPSMLEQNDVGNICHEHLEYYSLLSLKPLLGRHGLEIFDVVLNDVNGGSFRTYIRHCRSVVVPFEEAAERVKKLELYESNLGLGEEGIYRDFAGRLRKIKSQVVAFLKSEHEKCKVIHVYGASTKGNTILPFFGLIIR